MTKVECTILRAGARDLRSTSPGGSGQVAFIIAFLNNMNPYIARIKELSAKLDPKIQMELDCVFMDRTYRKGSFLLQPGQVCTAHFLIIEGIARKFYRHGKREITTEIYFHDSVAVSLDSYIMQQPSGVCIQALTELTVTVINYREFQLLSRRFPEVMEMDKMFIEYYAVWFEQRLREFQTLGAPERYRRLIDQEPRIVQSVPVTIIASYLNVSLETLSRIRSKLSRAD